MKSPKQQRRKFDQTLEAAYWRLVEHKEAKKHDDQSVSTTTGWFRDFKAGKGRKQILKSTRNLVLRAAEYADILEVDVEVTIGDDPPETFSHRAEKPSDYFVKKKYR
ncbi:MAG: hypothetical protein GY866_14365 [Proteobacteria bacterium]|nr:hypothetical protein [Pseudomonadota bacterium]